MAEAIRFQSRTRILKIETNFFRRSDSDTIRNYQDDRKILITPVKYIIYIYILYTSEIREKFCLQFTLFSIYLI